MGPEGHTTGVWLPQRRVCGELSTLATGVFPFPDLKALAPSTQSQTPALSYSPCLGLPQTKQATPGLTAFGTGKIGSEGFQGPG